MTTPRIVAMGGGGFLTETRPVRDHILALTGRDYPRVCFLPTAGGDQEQAIETFHERLGPQAETSALRLFWREVTDIEPFLLGQDVIYVGGGNTANMLSIWRLHGVDRVLAEAWRRGIILCGPSAGANCWFQACSTDSFGLQLAPLLDGLGFLAGSFCPHFDGEERREPTFRQWVGDGEIPPGWAVDDGVAIVFEGTEPVEAIAERDGGRALWIAPEGERALEVRRL